MEGPPFQQPRGMGGPPLSPPPSELLQQWLKSRQRLPAQRRMLNTVSLRERMHASDQRLIHRCRKQAVEGFDRATSAARPGGGPPHVRHQRDGR